MSRPRGRFTGDLLLIAATILVTLTLSEQAGKRLAPSAATSRAPALPAAAPVVRDRSLKRVLLHTYQRINDDRLLATAAGVVFYGLLAIFPAVTALVSSYGLFADPSTIGDNLQTLATMLPEGSFAIIQEQIGRVLSKGTSGLGAAFALGLVIAIWSANAGMKAVMDALNVAFKARETRSFIALNLVSLALTVAGLAAVLVMVGAIVVAPIVFQISGFGDDLAIVVRIGRWPILAALLLLGLAVLYRFGPSRPHPRWRWVSWGALTAAALWLAGSALLSFYLSNFANYTATYGSLGAAIGLMMWMWMSAVIVLCGAELDAAIELRDDRPAGGFTGR
jgi:membrane protein